RHNNIHFYFLIQFYFCATLFRNSSFVEENKKK
ncbi:hypothetical protein RB653_008172, partial [Dictyostelium firmibasis]